MRKSQKNSLLENTSSSGDLASAFNTLPVGIVIFNENQVLFINKAAVNIFKLSAAQSKQITSKSIYDFILPEYFDRIRTNNKKILKGEEFPPLHIRARNAKKEIIDLEVKSNTIVFNGKKSIQTVFTDISERVRSEKALTESKNDLNLILRGIDEIVYYIDFRDQRKMRFLSEHISGVLGVSPTDYEKEYVKGGKKLLKHVHPDDIDGVVKASEKLKKDKKPLSFVYRFKNFKTGEYIWLEERIFPQLDEKKNHIGNLGISRDITREKESTENLLKSEEKFKLIAEKSNDIIYFFTYQPQAKYLYVSPAAQRVLEAAPSAFYKDPYFMSKRVVNQREYKKLDQKIKADQKHNSLQPKNYIFQFKTDSGRVIWLEENYAPITDAEGNVQFILGIMKDITSEKIYRQEIEQKWLNYRNLVEGLPIGIFIHESGRIIFGNKEAYKITGLNPRKDHSQLSLVNLIVPEQRQLARERLVKSMKGEEIAQREYELLGNNKQKISIVLNSKPVIYNGKNAVQLTFQDISKERQLEKEKSRAELAERHNKELLNEIEQRNKIENKLNSIFESTTHLIWTVNRNFELTSFNKNMAEVFADKFGVMPEIGVRLDEILSEKHRQDYADYWYPFYSRVLLGNSLKFERKDWNSRGDEFYREIFINPIRNESGEIIEIACLAHDISGNKKFEQQILSQSAKLNAIFESTSHLIWTVDRNLNLTSYNKNYFRLIKDNLGAQPYKNVIAIEDTIKDRAMLKFWIGKYREVLKGRQQVFVHKSIGSSGETVFREMYLHPIYSNNEVTEVSVIAQDITERIKNEEQILEQSAKLKAIFESGSQLMWTINRNMELTSFNTNYAEALYGLYGVYPEVNKNFRMLSGGKTAPFQGFWDDKYEKAFNGQAIEFTTDRVNLNGTKVYRQYVLYPIKNEKGQVIEVSGLGFDITENKLNEEKIKASLQEKEVLLKEVHHRVKNNMQVISSILNLQSSYVKDTYALNLLKECQNRIKSMAFIHEALYQNKNFESVNFTEYISTISKNLLHSYSVGGEKIRLVLTLDNLFLNLDTSIPCGLIINEILSNSLKYAFPDNREGIIFVTLKNNSKKIHIEVGDNGIGIPESIDIKNTQSLGLQLVDTLVEQINGTLVLQRTKGTKFIIEFNSN